MARLNPIGLVRSGVPAKKCQAGLRTIGIVNFGWRKSLRRSEMEGSKMWNLVIGIGIGALVGMVILLIYEAVTSKTVEKIPSPYGMIDIPPDSELRAGREQHPKSEEESGKNDG